MEIDSTIALEGLLGKVSKAPWHFRPLDAATVIIGDSSNIFELVWMVEVQISA